MCGRCVGDIPQPLPAPGSLSRPSTSRRPLSRRSLLGAGLVIGATGVVGAAAAAAATTPANGIDAEADASLTVAPGLTIRPRDAWGSDLAPRAPMGPEDARFLLVHHTESPNSFTNQRDLIRIVYSFHTGPQKRWPDVAYNFFVGPDGTVWEGRAGSLAGPVVASATGGNQGFAQLVCLRGDFRNTTPPAAMQDSTVRLLAYLSVRHGISTWKDSRAEFVSRGSNKWAAGSFVSTPTISGHLDMSFTDCPGNGAYTLLPDWRRRVHPLAQALRQRTGLQRAERLSLEAP